MSRFWAEFFVRKTSSSGLHSSSTMFWRRGCAVLFLFAACIAIASDQGAQTHSSPAHVPARKITVIGVSNVGEVTPHLFRGGQPKLAGYEHLKEMGIDIVVDLRLSGKDKEERDVNRAGHEIRSSSLALLSSEG